MAKSRPSPPATGTLDPADWQAFRRQAHRMLDDAIDYVERIRERPLWQPIPDEVRAGFREPAPREPAGLAEVHDRFLKEILPYSNGNPHPGFMGWVHGGGTPAGMVAEMLAAALNANLGGRDHMPIEVERQIVRWMREIFSFPESASGLFVTGTSVANLIGVIVARDVALGFEARGKGVAAGGRKLTAYASKAAHNCVARALDFAGIGSDALRMIRADPGQGMDLAALAEAIVADRASGFTPFLLIGTAGTVDTGAIDDLNALADLARSERLWFHVDGAFGALGILAPEIAPRLGGIERADSLALDFHKWGQVPYDAGFILVRDGLLHSQAFASPAAYLAREQAGLAGGSPWPCDFGPDLSRGFRALKTWFTLKVYGTDALGAAIARTCVLARYLEARVRQTPELEMLAPVGLNIVCFRYRASDEVNAAVVVALHEAGEVAPSTTRIEGRLAIRAAIVNHRTSEAEIDTLVDRVVELGRGATPWQEAPWRAKDARLRELHAAIAGGRDSVALRFERACLLRETGRTAEARDAYLEVLARDPGHREALNNLGALLHETGFRSAARTAWSEAVTRYPDDAMSRVNLANALLEVGEVAPAREQFQAALRLEPGQRQAHQGMATVLDECGDADGAARHRRLAFGGRSVVTLPYRGEGRAVPVLLLAGAAGGNVPVRHLLDDRLFLTHMVFAEFFDPGAALPEHTLVFNAIGDADFAGPALEAARRILRGSSAPVINPPAAVEGTGRAANERLLAGIPGVVTPGAVRLPRAMVASCGFGFPLLVRSPGFHTGRHFARVEAADDLVRAVAGLPGDELIAMRYLDARGRDGKSRKYRVMMVDGRLYPLHLAISGDWKVHYFTADMAANEEHRTEEARFLEDMAGVLGERAMRGLSEVQARLGLDYAGVDFGLSPEGDVLLFEANATMVVNPPERPAEGSEDIWRYRRAAVERIHGAVREMLLRRAGAGA